MSTDLDSIIPSALEIYWPTSVTISTLILFPLSHVVSRDYMCRRDKVEKINFLK